MSHMIHSVKEFCKEISINRVYQGRIFYDFFGIKGKAPDFNSLVMSIEDDAGVSVGKGLQRNSSSNNNKANM